MKDDRLSGIRKKDLSSPQSNDELTSYASCEWLEIGTSGNQFSQDKLGMAG